MTMSPSTTGAPPEAFPAGARIAVLLPLPLADAYDYRVPDGLVLRRGDFVSVPLGRRRVAGVVWGLGESDIEAGRIKDVLARLDAPALTDAVLRFVDWVAAYTLSPKGAVLRMAMSIPKALEPEKPIIGYALPSSPVDEAASRLTAARRRVLDLLRDGPPRTTLDLARAAGVGTGVIKWLVEAGLVAAIEMTKPPAFAVPDVDRPGPELSPDQATAAADLEGKARSGVFSVTVLDGAPGSGKTEIYFQAIAEAIRQGRQALILLPEIALGAQWFGRFRARFGVSPAVWHSDLTGVERRVAWRAVATGEARVVVGARSALFLPFPRLGVIVVDEEHDPSYKQDEGVIYNARDMAVVRARFEPAPVVLVSATPSLETVVNRDDGRYGGLHIPDRRLGGGPPAIAAIDMRTEKLDRGKWLATPMVEAVAATLAAGEQALLFLNRRGYAPLTLCRNCGHRMRCPTCTAWLVEHRLRGRLQCHHCGYGLPLPKICPSCSAEDRLAACGPGVERLAEEVQATFPAARFLVAASDTVVGPKAAAELVRRIEEREVDLVVGTQILAKGYHFPSLTLVGVVDADLGLAGGDLRAAERTFQLLYQVAGRAGREGKPGRVLLQTYSPEHTVMRALVAGDRDGFLAAEAESRYNAGMPPFGRLVGLVLSSPDEPDVDAAARAMAREAPRDDGIQIWGPAPAPLALLRGRHRRRLLLKARRDIAVQPIVRRWLEAGRRFPKVRIQVDVDPYNFL